MTKLIEVESDALDAARYGRIMATLCERRAEYFTQEDVRDITLLAFRLRDLTGSVADILFGPDAA